MDWISDMDIAISISDIETLTKNPSEISDFNMKRCQIVNDVIV